MVKFIKNPDYQSTDSFYRMAGRTPIDRNLKSLLVRLFDSETEEIFIVTGSVLRSPKIEKKSLTLA